MGERTFSAAIGLATATDTPAATCRRPSATSEGYRWKNSH